MPSGKVPSVEPYCRAAGLTAELLLSNGPFPSVATNLITNGLVIELARFGRKRLFPLSKIVSWLGLFGIESCEERAVESLCKERDELRRNKKTDKIISLEQTVFNPQDWKGEPVLSNTLEPEGTGIPSAPALRPSPDSKSKLKKQNIKLVELKRQIKEKKRCLRTLNLATKEAKDKLEKINEITGHFSKRNINKRDKRYKCRIKELKQECMQSKNSQKEILNMQKLLSKKNKVINDLRNNLKPCERCPGLEQEVSKKEEEIKILTEKLIGQDATTIEMKDKNGAFNENVRLCVMNLAGLEVSTENIPETIITVAKYMFNYRFSRKDLPGRSAIALMVGEGGEIIQSIIAEKLEAETSWGLHKDGTSRKKQKFLANTVQLSSGENFPLGLSSVVNNETGAAICENVVEKLDNLADYARDPGRFISKVAQSLLYYMNDRAANEVKSNKLLNDWRQSVLTSQALSASEVHPLYCMAHLLLGFQNYTLKELASFQKENTADGSGRLGRHLTSSQSFKMLQAASRLCKTASDVFAPIGDHLGMRDAWEAYCYEHQIRSCITNYKDNRFNGLFEVSFAIMQHRQDFLHLIKLHGNTNAKIAGLRKDLEDGTLAIMTDVLGLMFAKVTLPMWNLVSTCSYLDVCQPLKDLFTEVCHFQESPDLFTSKTPLDSLKKYTDMDILKRVKMQESSTVSACLVAVLTGFKRCMKNQLKDFLSSHVSDERLKIAPSHNLSVERYFGELDASQKRRPAAKPLYHSNFIALKECGNLIPGHLEKLSKTQKHAYMVKIRYKASTRRKEQGEKFKSLKQNLLSSITSKSAASTKKKEKVKAF